MRPRRSTRRHGRTGWRDAAAADSRTDPGKGVLTELPDTCSRLLRRQIVRLEGRVSNGPAAGSSAESAGVEMRGMHAGHVAVEMVRRTPEVVDRVEDVAASVGAAWHLVLGSIERQRILMTASSAAVGVRVQAARARASERGVRRRPRARHTTSRQCRCRRHRDRGHSL